MNPLAILTFLKSELFKYIAGVILVAAIVFAIYHAGETHVQTKWNTSIAAAEKEKLELKVKEDKVTSNTEIKYVDRVKTITVKGATQIQYIDRYITREADAGCVIPKNVIMMHDSAIADSILSEDTK